MTDKAWLIEEIKSTRSHFNEHLRALPAEKMEQPTAPGGMTGKEVLYHVAWHEDQMQDMLRTHALVGSPWWNLTTDERNAHIKEEAGPLKVEEVVAFAEKSFAGMLEELEALPAEALDDPSYFAGMPSDWLPAEILAQNTYEHYREHYL
jgi:hypothetical protein